jgi:predicted XRE-type DNA-binding protein
MSDDFSIEEGSGNVFADLGLPNPEERLIKADLAMQIANGIHARRLTQAKAATLFGIDQPKISRLLHGQLSGFSTDRLIHFLTLFGQDVVIVVKAAAPHSHRLGHVSVVAEAPPASKPSHVVRHNRRTVRAEERAAA